LKIECVPSCVKFFVLYTGWMSTDPLGRVAGLAEPIRRALYRLVAAQPGGVSRDHAAEATRLRRSTASYHLDKLVEYGLLKTRYERLSGRQGPGAGRPAKIYERADRAIEVTVPPRDYATIAGLFAQAIEHDSTDARGALLELAHEYGRETGRNAEVSDGGYAALNALLTQRGYEPFERDRAVMLHNCPFDALATTHRALVCAMNVAILRGVIEGLDVGWEATLAPADNQCCVVMTPTGTGVADRSEAAAKPPGTS
jgi:predicted ArsR family transcriptional regulator